MKFINSKQKNVLKKGFSLVELIVVVAIFLVIAGITLQKQSKFSSDILISNLAYELALSIREAQVYGLGSKGLTIGSDVNFKVGYGIHINTSSADQYDFFADIPSGNIEDYVYNSASESGETLSPPVSLTRGQKIKKTLREFSEGSWECGNIGDNFNLNIVFVKPNPDAHLVGGTNGSTHYIQAVIVVESSTGDKCRIVRVDETGQIAVDPFKSDGSECAYQGV